MSLALPPPAPSPSITPHVHLSATLPSMSILRRLAPLHLRHRSRRLASVAAAAVRQDTAVWTPAPLSLVESAAESLFHVSIDVSDAPELVGSHTRPGQYLQLRVPDAAKPTFLAIASPPSLAAACGEFEFLVKSVAGSTAEVLCGLKRGDVVELSQVMGNGFGIDQIEPPEDYPSVFIFATGSGISPIRSLIESGFDADKRADVRLYYGARNLQRMAYQHMFKEWELSGVAIVPVLSQPDDSWTGETGYVQAAFNRSKRNFSPQSTGAVLCGQKQMAERMSAVSGYCEDFMKWKRHFVKLKAIADLLSNPVVYSAGTYIELDADMNCINRAAGVLGITEITSILLADGVSSEKILKNF